MAGKPERRDIQPGDIAHEFEWPDDAAELRQAEREAKVKRDNIRPAPLWLTALVLGLAIPLVFVFLIAFAGQAPGFFRFLVLPLVAGATLLALPVGLLLERATRHLRTGIPEALFLVIGGVLGFTWTRLLWTWVLSDWYLEWNTAGVAAETAAFADASSVFMAVTVGSAFFVARMWTRAAAYAPRFVYGGAAVIAALTVWSALAWVSDFGGAA